MLRREQWRWLSIVVAALLIWLVVTPSVQAQAVAPVVPKSTSHPKALVVRPATKQTCCCCRPGHCHMANCPGNPNYWRTHPHLLACCTCSCRPAPIPGAMLLGNDPRHGFLPILLRVSALALPTIAAVYPPDTGDILRSCPVTVPEQPPRVG